MPKIDISQVVQEVQKLYKDLKEASSIALGSDLKTLSDDNFLILPDWWQQGTNTKGIPLGGYVVIAGKTDSGKTTAAIQAMKAAQAQGWGVLYAETENKTTTDDLTSQGVDASQVMLVKESIGEKLFKKMFQLTDVFFAKFPNEKLLVIIDSLGNVLSRHDIELDLEKDSQKPGGKGKTNRLGLARLITRCRQSKMAMLLITYTYANIGSVGDTNAGGNALNLFSSLTYQTSRKSWLEKTVKGEKVRVGAKVVWKLYKNHIDKANPGPKVAEFDITSEGVKYVGGAEE